MKTLLLSLSVLGLAAGPSLAQSDCCSRSAQKTALPAAHGAGVARSVSADDMAELRTELAALRAELDGMRAHLRAARARLVEEDAPLPTCPSEVPAQAAKTAAVCGEQGARALAVAVEADCSQAQAACESVKATAAAAKGDCCDAKAGKAATAAAKAACSQAQGACDVLKATAAAAKGDCCDAKAGKAATAAAKAACSQTQGACDALKATAAAAKGDCCEAKVAKAATAAVEAACSQAQGACGALKATAAAVKGDCCEAKAAKAAAACDCCVEKGSKATKAASVVLRGECSQENSARATLLTSAETVRVSAPGECTATGSQDVIAIVAGKSEGASAQPRVLTLSGSIGTGTARVLRLAAPGERSGEKPAVAIVDTTFAVAAEAQQPCCDAALEVEALRAENRALIERLKALEARAAAPAALKKAGSCCEGAAPAVKAAAGGK